MNPYERTAQEMKRQSEDRPKKLAKNALAIGSTLGTAASFAPMLARAAPFLSEYIPENLAIKGLSKISPKFGSFVKGAMDEGFDFKEIKDFIGGKIKESQEMKSSKSPIRGYSEELMDQIEDSIAKGMSPGNAARNQHLIGKYNDIIKKIEKDYKTPFDKVIEDMFSEGNNQNQNKMEQSQQQTNQQPQQTAKQSQGIDPQLAQILQQGNAILQRFKGGNG